LEQRAAIISVVKGEEVDESAIPRLPEDANAPLRFEHTRDGKAKPKHTLLSRYGHLARNNVSITKWNTLEALKERYDKQPVGAGVKVKKEEMADEPEVVTPKKAGLPSTMSQRRSRGRDRTSRSVTGSSATPVKVEDDEDNAMGAAAAAAPAASASAAAAAAAVDDDDEDEADLGDDSVRYGEFGKPAHTRRNLARSKLGRKRSKSKSKNGFVNWHNMAASS
jgi:hypothetical protein